ncbi:MAG: FG-GAP-like repeat-containing protein [Gammaproteobacteria bacterium]|nr:FG-GAP-like repeat-containing protein [Gammaproteobacteria bacterium]
MKNRIFGSLGGALMLLACSWSGMSYAVPGGDDMTGVLDKTGIVRLNTLDNSGSGGGRCTGTILYSSASENQTWIVTAAHCFSNHDDLYYVHSHFTDPRAWVNYNGTTTQTLDSRVFVHPDWLSNGGHTSWFGPADIAFVRIQDYLPVNDASGNPIAQYERAIYVGDPLEVADNTASSPDRTNSLCGYGVTSRLTCGFTDWMKYYNNFREEFFHIPRSTFDGVWGFEGGDSGGPFLKFAPGMTNSSFGISSRTQALARHGVVMAVLQGPLVYTASWQIDLWGQTDPGDAIGARLGNARTWLTTIPGANVIPRLTSWTTENLTENCDGCVNKSTRLFEGTDWRIESGWCSHSGASLFRGDFNGDGKTDLLCHDTNGTKWIDFADALGQFNGTDWSRAANWCGGTTAKLIIGDYNGDGRDDMLCHSSAGNKYIDYANNSGQFLGTDWSRTTNWCSHGSAELLVGDVNGDHRADLICHDTASGYKWIDYADTYGRFYGTNWERDAHWCSHTGAQIRMGDFNGDGRTDMLCHDTAGNKWVDLADNYGRFNGSNWSANTGFCAGSGNTLLVGDFNNDYRDDLLCHESSGNKSVDFGDSAGRLSGADWARVTNWCSHSGAKVHTGDFNGDGKDDMLCHDSIGRQWVDYAR